MIDRQQMGQGKIGRLAPARRYLIGCIILATAASSIAQDFRPDIPKAWDDKEVERFELPLAQRDRTPRHMAAEEYYKLKVRPSTARTRFM